MVTIDESFESRMRARPDDNYKVQVMISYHNAEQNWSNLETFVRDNEMKIIAEEDPHPSMISNISMRIETKGYKILRLLDQDYICTILENDNKLNLKGAKPIN